MALLPPSRSNPLPAPGMSCSRLVLLLALSLAAPACRSTARPKLAPVRIPTVAGVGPRYAPILQALAAAVEDHDDAVARRIAANMRLRLAADAARGADASRADARALLDGFDRVLEGRRLVDTLDLQLDVRPVEGQPATRVVLRVRTRSNTRLELRPGGALLRVQRVSLTPEGKESRAARTCGVGNVASLVLDEGWLEVPLGTFATTIPSNALGARTRWSLDMLGGEILEEGTPYPAQNVQVEGVERVDLAPFLTNTPVDPADLAAYVQRPGVALAPILERTVRIAPDRRDEALDLLTPLVETMVPEQISTLVPTLRWLSPTSTPGRDPLAWRAWLRLRKSGG